MKKILIFSLILLPYICYSDNKSEQEKLKSNEDSLTKLAIHIINGETVIDRQSGIYHFEKLLIKTLQKEESFEYPFDSLNKFIPILTPKDKSFRIYNWHLAKDDKTYKHFGIMQLYQNDSLVLIPLHDQSDEILNPHDTLLNPACWYGAHYYTIIQTKYRRKKYYTLLGWDGNNVFSTKKLIEIMHFENGQPVFGAPVFKMNVKSRKEKREEKQEAKSRGNVKKDKNLKEAQKIIGKYKDKKAKKRIIFEYDSQAMMILRYIKKKKRIIFDHLVPKNPEFEGNYAFYGPSMIFNAVKFKRGKWTIIKDIDVRNQK